MLEFDDLSPLDFYEINRYYPLDWYLDMTCSSTTPAGFQILPSCVDHWNRIVCNKEIKCLPGTLKDDYGHDYNEVVCLLRKYHQGKCLCWVPSKGIISYT